MDLIKLSEKVSEYVFNVSFVITSNLDKLDDLR